MIKKGERHPNTAILIEKVLRFITTFIVEHDFSPSIREIAEHIGKSTSHTNLILSHMEKDGLIQKQDGVARSIRVVGFSGTRYFWQSIDTAPKDGRLVILFQPDPTPWGANMFIASWTMMAGFYQWVVSGSVDREVPGRTSWESVKKPTHWAELPIEPKKVKI